MSRFDKPTDPYHDAYESDVISGKYVSERIRKMSEGAWKRYLSMEDSNPPAVQAMIDKSMLNANGGYMDWHNDPQHNIEPTIKQDEKSRQQRLEEDAWDLDFSPLYRK